MRDTRSQVFRFHEQLIVQVTHTHSKKALYLCCTEIINYLTESRLHREPYIRVKTFYIFIRKCVDNTLKTLTNNKWKCQIEKIRTIKTNQVNIPCNQYNLLLSFDE